MNEKEIEALRERFSKYVDPSVTDEILRGEAGPSLAEILDVTFLLVHLNELPLESRRFASGDSSVSWRHKAWIEGSLSTAFCNDASARPTNRCKYDVGW